MSRALLDKRAAAWATCEELITTTRAAGRVMTAEERSTYERAAAEVNDFTTQLETEAEHRKMADLQSRWSDEDADQVKRNAQIADAGHRADPSADDTEYRAAFDRFLRGQSALELRNVLRSGESIRAGVVGTDSLGGFLVPKTMHSRIVEVMRTFGQVLPYCEVITTDSGETYNVPTNDDTAEGVQVGETPAEADHNATTGGGASEDLTFGNVPLGAFWYSSRRVLLSFALIQDSAFDVEGMVTRKIGQRLGRITGRRMTVGTGSSQPQGIVTGAGAGVTAAAAGAVTWIDLVKLEHSVDPVYRLNGRYMFNDLVLQGLKLAVDSQNRPLWVPSTREGEPDRIGGYPYVVNSFMANPATTVKTVLFGDFREAFLARLTGTTQLMTLREKYAEQFQVGYLGYMRFDSRTVNASAVKVLVQP
jgi:HK97 family phage major capsid protein